MDKWTPKQVSEWLQKEFEISEQKADNFASENINGKLLLKFSEERLTKAPFRLTTGHAMMVMEHIEEFKNASGKIMLLFAFY